jgi:hypothetical protein
MNRSVEGMVALLLLAVMSSSLLAADVIIVDAAGGGDATTISGGISLAADGDIVLVKPGVYTGLLQSFGVIGKSLTVVGDTGGEVIAPNLTIADVPEGGLVVVRNVSIVPGPNSIIGRNILVDDCAGLVLLQDVEAIGKDGQPVGFGVEPGFTGLRAIGNDALVPVDCTLHGGDGFDTEAGETSASTGGVGVFVSTSSLALYGCDVRGGDGGSDVLHGNGGRDGATGLWAAGANVYATGGSIHGGDAGDGGVFNQTDVGCAGGVGMVAVAWSLVRVIDLDLSGGAGGAPDGGGTPGPDGEPLEEANSRVVPYAGTARRLELPAVLREGESGTLTVSGVPGDLVGVFVAETGGALPLSGPVGIFVPAEPLVGPLMLGPLPAEGQVDLPFTVPTLPGVDGLVLLAQGYVLAQDGSERLTNPSALVLVAAGF